MLRKTMIALFAMASVGMLAPDAASARGGFGGGGGGFHGGGFHGGGFHGGGGSFGGGFRGGGIGMGGGGFRAAAIGGGGFRTAGDRGRWFPAAALPAADFAAAACRQPFPRGFHHGFRHRRFPLRCRRQSVSAWATATTTTIMMTAIRITPITAMTIIYGDGGCYIVGRAC